MRASSSRRPNASVWCQCSIRSTRRCAGTAWISTSVITPSIPTEVWTAGRRGSSSPTSITSPDAITSRARRSDAENDCSLRPEPCVHVPMAPAMPCVSMSPWLPSAKPAFHSGRPSSATVVPGSADARPVAPSTPSTPCRPSMVTSVPSVRWTGVNECPAATQRTCRASRTAACTSSSEAGATISAGLQDWLPTQFVNVAIRTAPSRCRGRTARRRPRRPRRARRRSRRRHCPRSGAPPGGTRRPGCVRP